MAEFTENLNLELPAKTEQYNIAVQNSNMKKIDDFSKLTPPRALTADKLTAGVKINDIFFDGTEDIQITTGGGGLTMFAHIWSDHIYNDISYLRADTFSWHYATVYKTGYEILEEQYNHEKSVQKTENGIIYRLTPDNFKIADVSQQDKIRSLYENTGSAWYYIIDIENRCFKLPREKSEWELKGTAPVDIYGNGMTLGLTDGTNKAGLWCTDNNSTLQVYDTVYGSSVGYTTPAGKTISNKTLGITTDPTKSGIEGTVKLSNTIERKNTDRRKYLYFYVGQSKRPETEVNLGQTSEALNNKVDLDGGNYKGSELEEYVNDTCLNDKRTNCITEIPQRIKLELNNGVLTLKAGSVVIIPNGFEEDGVTPKFDYVTTIQDIQYSITSQYDKVFLFITKDLTGYVGHQNEIVTSGNVEQTTTGTHYNTSLNVITSKVSSGEFYEVSLPVCTLSTDSSGAVTSFNVFNGMGYIGSTLWVDKGVKGLIPNGRNEDGTLNNIEFTSDRIYMRTFATTSSANLEDLIFTPFNPEFPYFRGALGGYKVTDDNYLLGIQRNEILKGFVLCSQSRENSKITKTIFKQPFRAVDYNDFANTPHIVETYQNGTSWYRIYSDGWCEQGQYWKNFNNNTSITFLKKYAIKPTLSVTGLGNSTGGAECLANVSTTGFTINDINYGGTIKDGSWEAKGYIA